jgi:uncharacterized membrane protein
MEEPLPIETIPCENCSSATLPGQAFCTSCGYPQNGTEDQKNRFRDSIRIKKVLVEESRKETKTARTIIFVFAAIYFGLGLFHGFVADEFPVMIAELFVCLLFLILGAWSNKNPFGAILTAFMVYLTFQFVDVFFDPTTLFKGIIFKVFIIAAFIKGIRSATEAQKYHRELEKMKAVRGDD